MTKLKTGDVVRLHKPGHTYHGKLADVKSELPDAAYLAVIFRSPYDQSQRGFLSAAIKRTDLRKVAN